MSVTNPSLPLLGIRSRVQTPDASPAPRASEPHGRRYSIVDRDPSSLIVSRRALRTDKSGRQREALQRNLRRFGCVVPVLIDSHRQIVHGHQVVAAAKAIGLATIPTVTLEGLSEAELRALRLSLHKIEELSSWDPDSLKIELAELAEVDHGELLVFTGFGTEEIDVILHPTEEEQDPDEETPLAAIAVSRKGDLWEFAGGHRLTCGDACEAETYARLMRGSEARLVLADPPYNVKIAGHVSGRAAAREFAEAAGEMSPDQFTAFLSSAFRLAAKHSLDGSLHLFFMDWRHVEEMMAAGRAAYDELKNIVVWDKTNAGMGSLWRSKHELLFAWKRGTADHVNNIDLGRHGRWRSNVWSYAGANSFSRHRDQDLAGHVTPKPVAMLYDAILDVSKPRDLVLDCFCGAGSTLVAAHRARRIGLGIELDPLYVDAAVRRLETEIGAPARHEESGLTFAELAAQRGAAEPASAL